MQIRRYEASKTQNPSTLFLIQSDFFVLQRTLTCPVQTSAAPMSTESKYSPSTALLPCPILSCNCVLHVDFKVLSVYDKSFFYLSLCFRLAFGDLIRGDCGFFVIGQRRGCMSVFGANSLLLMYILLILRNKSLWYITDSIQFAKCCAFRVS